MLALQLALASNPSCRMRWKPLGKTCSRKPFIWTADPDAIIEKVSRGKQVLESIHEELR